MEIKFTKGPLMGGDPSKCRVLIPGRTNKFDMSDLNRFGSIIVPIITRHAIYPDESDSFDLDGLERRISLGGDISYDPRKDYLALVGDALMQAIVCTMFGRVWSFHWKTYLRYDSQSQAYWPMRIK